MESSKSSAVKSVRLAYGSAGYELPLDIPGLVPEVFLPANPRALDNAEAVFKGLCAIRSDRARSWRLRRWRLRMRVLKGASRGW